MRRGAARQGFRRALLKKACHPEPLGLDALEVELRGAGARDCDQVDPVGHEAWSQAKALTAEALHPVSLHRAADLATHDEPEPRGPGGALGRQQEREVRRSHAPRGAIGLRSRELRVLAEPAVRTEGGHGARAIGRERARDYFL